MNFKKITLIGVGLISSLIVFGQQTVNINVTANKHAISPYIYGVNIPTANATAVRWGGNRMSAYNWENNFSNAGEDYNNSSDRHFINGLTSADQAKPAIPIINLVNQAKSRNQYALVTLQAAGYVSADADGSVDESEIAPSARWKEVRFSKGSAYSLTPDLTDDYVYIDEMVNYLNEKLGPIGNGGIDGFAIDNEASIWSGTHPLIRPEVVTFDEFFYKTREIGKLVKNICPDADVYGGVFYGWSDLNSFNKATTSNFNYWVAKKNAEGYTWFVDFFLDSLKQVETELGKRIVDVLDLHWYPEAKGTTNRIVDLAGTLSDSDLITPDMISARLQAPRSLWDLTYSENSYIGLVKLIPRLKESINQYYPGTKIAFTEFKYDAEFHFSGGLALVDVLGVFGREGIYAANKWDPLLDDFGGAAYKLYLNYDNQGSTFGDESVEAIQSANSILSTFASVDKENKLHIIVVNKLSQSQTSTFNIANGYYSEGVVFGFDQNDKTVRSFADVDTVLNSSFTYTLPAYSALHFILEPLSQISLEMASIKEGQASQIVLQYSDDVTILNVTSAIDEFVVTNTLGDTLDIASVSIDTDISKVILNLVTPIVGNDSVCKVSYSGIQLTNSVGTPIASFKSIIIKNELVSAPLYCSKATVNEYGKEIYLDFSKEIQTPLVSNGGLSLLVNSQLVAIDSSKINADGYSLILYPSQRIIKYDTISIVNTDGTLTATDATVATLFSVSAENNGPNYSPEIDSTKMLDNYRFYAYFNSDLVSSNFNTVGFQVYKNGNPISATISYSNKLMTFTTSEPMFKEDICTISYIDNNNVYNIYGGYLDAFENRVITNNLKTTPSESVVSNTAVTKIEFEDYAYHRSSSVLENCSDIGGGKHVGFIGNGNVYGYNIDVQNADTYTFSIRHAGVSDNGQITLLVDGAIVYSRLYVPKSGNWNTWINSNVAIDLTSGAHTLEVYVNNAGFNANWLSFEAGNNPSNADLIGAQTSTTGNTVYLIYNRKLETMPMASELSITSNTKPIAITNIAYYNNDSTRLALQTGNSIYVNEAVVISYTTTSGRTLEGGILNPVTNSSITNKSSVINSIEAIDADIQIYPIPCIAGSPINIELSGNEEVYFTVTTIDGKEVACGNFVNNTQITISASGTYILNLQIGSKSYTKKIRIN